MKNSFVLYKMWSPMIAAMPEKDAGRLFKAIYAYQANGEILPYGDSIYPVFAMIKAQLDEDKRRYDERCAMNAKNGATGGRPKKETETEKNRTVTNGYERLQMVTNGSERKQSQAKKADSDSDSDSDSDIKDKRTKNRRFTPPSLSEIQAYCDERKNGINAQKFLDFYESRGWKYGGTKITDWKACIRTWENRAKEKANTPIATEKPKQKVNSFNGFENQHSYDFDALASILAQAPSG